MEIGKSPETTAESIRWALANNGYGYLVDGKDVDMPRHEQLAMALIKAAECGLLDLAQELVASGADPRSSVGFDPPLITAAEQGHIDVVDYLLSLGVDINQRGSVLGETALMSAAANGQSETVRALIDRGADVLATDPEGKTAADWASMGFSSGHWEFLGMPAELRAAYETVFSSLGLERPETA